MTIEVLPRSEPEAASWATALSVAGALVNIPWVLIGAQMVMLLEQEAGVPTGRTTGDIDALVDVRALAGATRSAADRLLAAGFDAVGTGHPYRFQRGLEQVDLLAPDHLGRRVDLTTMPPGVTTQVPGGTRALATRRHLSVRIVGAGSEGLLPVPSLAGAIVLKVRAWEARQAPRDAEDLARLLALSKDIEALRASFKSNERAALSRVGPLAADRSRTWSVAADPEDARAAFRRLTR